MHIRHFYYLMCSWLYSQFILSLGLKIAGLISLTTVGLFNELRTLTQCKCSENWYRSVINVICCKSPVVVHNGSFCYQLHCKAFSLLKLAMPVTHLAQINSPVGTNWTWWWHVPKDHVNYWLWIIWKAYHYDTCCTLAPCNLKSGR